MRENEAADNGNFMPNLALHSRTRDLEDDGDGLVAICYAAVFHPTSCLNISKKLQSNPAKFEKWDSAFSFTAQIRFMMTAPLNVINFRVSISGAPRDLLVIGSSITSRARCPKHVVILR